MEITKTNRGRIGKYETHVKPHFEDIREWVSKGATDKEIIAALDIGKDAFYTYKKKHPEFAELLKVERKPKVEEIKAAIFRRATGFHYTERKTVTDNSGNVRTEVHERYALPDPACAMILLKHWAKDEGWTNDPQSLELRKKELEIKKDHLEKVDW